MASKQNFIGLDVGTKRVGVAVGDSESRVAQPLATIAADEIEKLRHYLQDYQITDIVVGLPRNQAGETTTQTDVVKQFVMQKLMSEHCPIHWQDESVTSVIAEERLRQRKKPYTKANIDAEAAAIILQDFLETL